MDIMPVAISSFHPAALLATWFGAGKSPKAPGTAGSLAALPFAATIAYVAGPFGLLAAAVLTFAVGVWASRVYMQRTGTHDPGEIVIDEVAGMFLILAPLPLTWEHYAAGFLLFRLFDIWKPWPVSLADRSKTAFGVMADDILAALYPYFVLVVVAWVARQLGMPIDFSAVFGG